MSDISGGGSEEGEFSNVKATQSIELEGKYILPLDAPPSGDLVILSQPGSTQLIWGNEPGNGNVIGASSSIPNAVVIWDGATGKKIKDSGLLISEVGKKP